MKNETKIELREIDVHLFFYLIYSLNNINYMEVVFDYIYTGDGDMGEGVELITGEQFFSLCR